MQINTYKFIICLFAFFTALANDAFAQSDITMSIKQGDLFYANKDYPNAIKKYTVPFDNLKLARQANADQFLHCTNQLGLCYYYQEDYSTAITIFKTAFSEYYINTNGKSGIFASLINNLAASYMDIHEYYQAEKLYKQSLTIKKAVHGYKSLEYAITLNNLADFYNTVGKFSAAEPLYKEAIFILKSVNETKTSTYAKTLNNLAELYLNLGLYDLALENFLKSKSIKQNLEIPDDKSYAVSLLNLANCYVYLGYDAKAMQSMSEGLSLLAAIEGTSTKQYALALSNLAEVYIKIKDFEKGKKSYEMAIEIFIGQKLDTDREMYEILSSYALLLHKMGNKEKAHLLFEKCLTFYQTAQIENTAEYTTLCMRYGDVLLQKDEVEKADKMIVTAFEQRKSDMLSNFKNLSEKEKTKYLEKNQYFLNNFRNYCIKRTPQKGYNPPSSAYSFSGLLLDFQLFYKGIIFNSIASVKNRIESSSDTTLMNKYNEWENTRAAISALANQKKKSPKLALLVAKANEMEKELSTKSEAYSSFYTKDFLSWNELKTNLAPHEVCVDIIRVAQSKDTTQYYAIIFDNNFTEPKLIKFEFGHQFDKRYYKYYKNNILTRLEDGESYNNFWKAVDENLPEGTTKIFLSNEGVYNQLNINTLLEEKTKKYMIEKYDIEIVTNLSEILWRKKEQKVVEKGQYYLFGRPQYVSDENKTAQKNEDQSRAGNPSMVERGIPFTDLPGTEKEVKGIELLLSKSSNKYNIFMGKDATEEKLSSLKEPYVLHLATHGYFIQDKSNSRESLLRSGLVMANVDPSKPVDGLLTAYELVNFDLSKTELLVLSACETGLGDVMLGEGVYGLQRAAKIAGAKAVLISLWTVSDQSTYELMVSFYAKWLSTGDKRKAFRAAQLELLKKYPHPYYWGAFYMVGH